MPAYRVTVAVQQQALCPSFVVLELARALFKPWRRPCMSDPHFDELLYDVELTAWKSLRDMSFTSS
jgi:hypothetical protein